MQPPSPSLMVPQFAKSLSCMPSTLRSRITLPFTASVSEPEWSTPPSRPRRSRHRFFAHLVWTQKNFRRCGGKRPRRFRAFPAKGKTRTTNNCAPSKAALKGPARAGLCYNSAGVTSGLGRDKRRSASSADCRVNSVNASLGNAERRPPAKRAAGQAHAGGRRAHDANSLTLAKPPHVALPWPRGDP
jgi:hypothetical protein